MLRNADRRFRELVRQANREKRRWKERHYEEFVRAGFTWHGHQLRGIRRVIALRRAQRNRAAVPSPRQDRLQAMFSTIATFTAGPTAADGAAEGNSADQKRKTAHLIPHAAAPKAKTGHFDTPRPGPSVEAGFRLPCSREPR